jgi:hypothetical protein
MVGGETCESAEFVGWLSCLKGSNSLEGEGQTSFLAIQAGICKQL